MNSKKFDLGAGYEVVLVKTEYGDFASISKGGNVLWTGDRAVLKASVDRVARERAN